LTLQGKCQFAARFAVKIVPQNSQEKSRQNRGKRHSDLPRNFAASLPRVCRNVATTWEKIFRDIVACLPQIFKHFLSRVLPGILPRNLGLILPVNIRVFATSIIATITAILPRQFQDICRNFCHTNCCDIAACFLRFCRNFAASLQLIYRDLAAILQQIWRAFAAYLPRVCSIFTASLLLICIKFVVILVRFCSLFTPILLQLCRLVAANLLRICRNFAAHLPQIC
jgi:hypothetical protein